MDVDGAVAKEASETSLGRNVKVRVSKETLVSVLRKGGVPQVREHLLSCEWAYGDVAVLAGEISNLAGLWLRVVTRRDLATDIRIKMSQCGGTVSVGRDWLVVDVVHYASVVRKMKMKVQALQAELTKWAKRFTRKASKEDIEENACAVRVRRGRNIALNAAGAGKRGIVGHALWVVLGDSSIPQFACCAWNRKSIVCG